MELSSLQHKICDAVLVNIKASRPSVIQIGQRGGKDIIISEMLKSSSITSPLIVTPEPSNFKKRNADVSFMDVYNHNDFDVLVDQYVNELSSCTSRSDDFDDFDFVVLAEPWFWVLNSGRQSEYIYNRVVDLFDGRVLAIGSYCQTNIWSFDGLIPKYTSYETNPSMEETVKNRLKEDQIHAQWAFGRNL